MIKQIYAREGLKMVSQCSILSGWCYSFPSVHGFILLLLQNIFLFTLSCKHISRLLVAQLCPTLCDPMDCSPPHSCVHEICQARILEWVAISFSRGSSQPRDRTRVSCTAGKFFTDWATTSCKILGWMKHKLESRLLGEISITSDMQMTPPLWQKVKKN